MNKLKTDDKEKILHIKFIEYGKNAKKWMKKCIILIPEIEKYRIWKKKGFDSIYEYAAKLAGMSRNTVNESLRIIKKVADKPELKKVVEEKGIWKVRPTVTIATKETDKFWAEKAREMPHDTLSAYVKEIRKLDCRRAFTAIHKNKISSLPESVPKNGCENSGKTIVLLDLSQELACELEKIKTENWDKTIKTLLKLRKENLQSLKPQKIKTNSKTIPTIIKKYIIKRSNLKCEFPLCKKDYHSFHHADRFSLVYEHDPDRIFALCKEHHNLAHLSLFENEELDIKLWKIRKTARKNDLKYLIDQKVLAKSS